MPEAACEARSDTRGGQQHPAHLQEANILVLTPVTGILPLLFSLGPDFREGSFLLVSHSFAMSHFGLQWMMRGPQGRMGFGGLVSPGDSPEFFNSRPLCSLESGSHLNHLGIKFYLPGSST